MKRSEALNLIWGIILDNYDDLDFETANGILTKLEDSGVKPPWNPKNLSDYPNSIFEWEDEDE